MKNTIVNEYIGKKISAVVNGFQSFPEEVDGKKNNFDSSNDTHSNEQSKSST